MTLFRNLPFKALRDNRDHIMVVTQQQNITTLRLRDVLQITGHHIQGQAVVTCRKELEETRVVIQENAPEFLQRCKGLLEALTLEDCVLINQHYCPKRQAS